MQLQDLLTELLDLAGRLNIEVRHAPLGGAGGGLCLLRGRRVLFVDTQATLPDQVARTATGLAQEPQLEDCFLLPQVR